MSLNKPKQSLLLTLAWQSIAHGLKTQRPLNIDIADYPPEFAQPQASFITLKIAHHLRGSFGQLRPIRPLAEDICENAFAAAFCDRRHPALTDMELPELKILIDIVSPLEPLSFKTELDLVGLLRNHIDGLLLEEGSHHAFLLPKSWETYPAPMSFLQQVKQKAGLPATYWTKTIKAYRFTTERID